MAIGPVASILLPSDAVAVGVGAVFGALSRHHVGRVAADWIATDPKRLKYQGWHTAAINVGGSFLLGGIAGTPLLAPNPPSPTTATAAASSPSSFLNTAGLSPRMKLLLGVGFCGSFTTFSTYSVDVVTWLQSGQTVKAFQYVCTNNVGGIVAAATGMMLVKKLFGR